MAENRQHFKRYHIDFTSGLLLLLAFCAVALIFSFALGCDVMFYAGFPMLTAAAAAWVGAFCADGFVAERTAVCMRRGRVRAAIGVLRDTMKVSLVWGALIFVVLFAVSGPLCEALYDFPDIASVCRAFAPAAALMMPVGCLTGFLRGIGQHRMARMGIWMTSALFPLLSLSFGFYGSYRGIKVGALLLNDDMSAIYCACGIAIGLDLAVGITMAMMAVLCRIHAGRLRHAPGGLNSDGEADPREDNPGLMQRYFIGRMFPSIFTVSVPLLAIVIGYRFWVSGQSNTAIITSVWGGFMGIGLPILIGSAILAALPMTALTGRALREERTGRVPAYTYRISMILRLSAYISIPWSVFCFGAANEIIALFPNLTMRGQMAAIMTVKYGCVLVFLLQTMLLMGYFFRNCRQDRALILSTAVALFAQLIALAVMRGLGLGIVMLILSADIYACVFLIVLYIMGRQAILRELPSSWIIDDGLITVCSLIAVIPIELLNDYLIAILPGIAAFPVAAVIYAALFVLSSILLKAADLRNVERIPGGGIVVSLAYALGAVQAEEEE